MTTLTPNQQELCPTSRGDFSAVSILEDAGGVSAHHKQRAERDAGCRSYDPNRCHR